MPKLRNVILLLLIALGFWHFYGETLKTTGFQGVFDEIQSDINLIKANPLFKNTVDFVKTEIEQLLDKNEPKSNQPIVEKPQLDIPTDQTFSVHNIEIGDARSYVEKIVGQPKRSSMNEYGVDWVAYHESYHNFFMVAYDKQDLVVGLYTNQDLLSSSVGIELGTTRESVLAMNYDPLEYIRKGWVSYQINSEEEYDFFQIDDNYVTIFYDIEEGNSVTAILIVNDNLEKMKEEIYGKPSKELKEGFEYQLFDLTNAARVKNDLPALTFDEAVKETARSHSTDMAENYYFNHTNLEGKSPFDRMAEDDIVYSMAGENIAMGQFSSIFAHEGLMNSPGHRKNILLPEYEALGVGVDFNKESQPYYTENFLSQ
ncbi:CAP domain-containing protein [Bacillus niameyensis]|uniref:CAP domain-containing protein n=1 Tax=Bacillus niameyensis TaxID=1522308 RepID=UPI0007837904|nr:CAP-associated domain-containing protein [Bacillus niameyensis]